MAQPERLRGRIKVLVESWEKWDSQEKWDSEKGLRGYAGVPDVNGARMGNLFSIEIILHVIIYLTESLNMLELRRIADR